ncbi:MAG: septum formation protein Maf [Firmicutes bacterium]|nr:septum formation protein Maf [Bacillota bacterium]HOB35078.1 Maf family protein [Bacillota bacterium]HPZ90580.1 Maf family protein [Bacillota bacterium]HQE02198.1 Maf family protein [Bacillota bacterium]
MTLVLASASPRRQELIRRVTEDFVVCPADVDEANIPYQTPAEYTLSMAVGKALAVSGKTPHPVLGADTVVCLGARILGKPRDAEENRAMLRALSGRWHTVLTAVALCRQGRILGTEIVATRVRFLPLREQDIEELIQTGDGLDKAGGYGIQGPAGKYIAGIDGCYYNVMGLPVAAVASLLRAHV